MSHFMKILLVGAELLRTDGQTNDEANSRFSQYLLTPLTSVHTYARHKLWHVHLYTS